MYINHPNYLEFGIFHYNKYNENLCGISRAFTETTFLKGRDRTGNCLFFPRKMGLIQFFLEIPLFQVTLMQKQLGRNP